MRTRPILLFLTLFGAAPVAAQDGRELFLRHCATCHGTTGHGDGPTVVVPRPRDLTSGRFSFGTTPDALAKTIRGGITPAMPPFGETLGAADVEALVGYVRSLMPVTVEASPDESRVVVGDRPRVVSGPLVPRAGHSEPFPRGLFVALPGGFAIEYATDDFRMLRILYDDATVDRTDWRGRGGTPRVPAGKLLDELCGDDIGPIVRTWDDQTAMAIRYRGHRVDGADVTIDGEVLDGRRVMADYRETVHAVAIGGGTGFLRRIEFRVRQPLPEVRLMLGPLALTSQVTNQDRNTIRGFEMWRYGRDPGHPHTDVWAARGPRTMTFTQSQGLCYVLVPFGDRPLLRVEVLRLALPRFSGTMAAELSEGFDG